MDARDFEGYTKLTDMGYWHRPHLRYHGFDIYNPADTEAEWNDVKAVWSPYLFGFATEVTVAEDGSYVAEKQYALGRQSFELSYVMPDQKTVYSTDDGTNVILTMFIADTAADLSAGTLYAARFHQTSNVGAGAADVEWISLGHATHDEVKAYIDADVTFSQIFSVADPVLDANGDMTGECPDSFRAVNTTTGFQCLSLNAGMEIAASRLETRRYAGYMGATTELRKEEGLAFDPVSGTLFVAISEIERGMEDFKKSGSDNNSYDLGSGNHLQLEHNDCGAIYAMDIEVDNVLGSDYVARNWYGIVEGKVMDYGEDSAYAGNSCSVTSISNPDNVTFIPGYNTLIIGEDTSKHENNMIWAYDMVTGEMTRIMTVHDEAETTSPYWYPNLNGNSYMTAVSQHAFDNTGFFGVLGPFPDMRID
jgi:secreted PhoX family phosphatase